MRKICSLAALAAILMILAGCEATAKSDKMERQWQRTASYEKIFSVKAKPSPIRPRKWAGTQATYEPCTVTHFAGYFDDEFVTVGDGDDAYGWTWADAAAFGYSPFRFIVNTICVPASMVKDPPGVLVTTDLEGSKSDGSAKVPDEQSGGSDRGEEKGSKAKADSSQAGAE